jgi:outer membrane protein TolC
MARGQESASDGLTVLHALELMRRHDPNIALAEARLAAARGAVQVAQGRFDPRFTASTEGSDSERPTGPGATAESRALDTSTSLVTALRSGQEVTATVAVNRSEAPGSPDPALNLGTLTLSLRQPLLRDRRRGVVTAPERAFEERRQAELRELEHTVALRTVEVVDRYWRAVAAMANVDILRASEASSRQLLANTRRLVAADVTPAADLVLLEADLAAKEVARIRGEGDRFAALQALGREIGLESGAIRTLAEPGEPLPSLAIAQVPPQNAADDLIALALAERDDVAAARRRLDAEAILTSAAEDALKPRLDLLITPSYTGLAEGSGLGDLGAALFDEVPGLAATIGLTFTWPTFNRTAEGALVQAQAARRSGASTVDLLERGIGADVPTALDAVRRGAAQWEGAIRAVGLFEQAVSNEEKKLQAGSSTLIDVISQRDRLTAARQSEVSARLTVALALLDLRFQTGTLLAAAGESATERRRRLVGLPPGTGPEGN